MSASRSGNSSRSISEFSDADGVVGRQPVRFVKRGVHEVVGDAAGTVTRGELARQHLRRAEAAFVKQFLWDDHDLVPGQRGADDRVRTGDVIGEAIAGHDVDATAALFEMRDAVGLEQYLDVGMFAQFCAGDRVRDAMLARLDLTQL